MVRQALAKALTAMKSLLNTIWDTSLLEMCSAVKSRTALSSAISQKAISTTAKTYDALPKGQGVIFDGFPRTIAQAEALKTMLAERGDDMGMMIELVVGEDVLMARLLNRAKEQGRADDNEETIKKRFEVYHNQTAPLADWFEKEGIRNTFTWKGSKETMLSEIFAAIENNA